MERSEREDVWADSEPAELSPQNGGGFPERSLEELGNDYRIKSAADPTAPTAERLAAAESILKQSGGEKLAIADDERFVIGGNLDNDPNTVTPEQAKIIAEIAKNNEGDNAQLIGARTKLTNVPTTRALGEMTLTDRDTVSRDSIPKIQTRPAAKPWDRPAPKEGFFKRLFGG